jgi:hypothetical protein
LGREFVDTSADVAQKLAEEGTRQGAPLVAAAVVRTAGAVTNGVTREAQAVLQPRLTYGVGGRVESAFAKIEAANLRTGTATTAASRAEARAMGLSSDDAGHLIANALGGKGGKGFVVPQSPGINRGAFRAFEARIAQDVRAGKEVYIRVVPSYSGPATRPAEIMYQVRVDGKTTSVVFPNPQ